LSHLGQTKNAEAKAAHRIFVAPPRSQRRKRTRHAGSPNQALQKKTTQALTQRF
jgi:hypothetical protein